MKKFELVSTRLCSIMEKNGNKLKKIAINYTLFKIIAAKYVRILTLHVKKIFFCFLIFNDAKKRQARCPHLKKDF